MHDVWDNRPAEIQRRNHEMTDTNKITALLETSDMLTAWETLQGDHARLHKSLMDDARAGYPAWILPMSHPYLARHVAIENEATAMVKHPWLADNLALFDHVDHVRIAQALETVFFADRQDARATLVFPGIAGVSEATLGFALQVNRARAAFKAAVVALKETEGRANNLALTAALEATGWRTRDPHLSKALGRMKLSRICLKQVYRPIPVIEDPRLRKLSYYVHRRRSLTPTTAGEQAGVLGERLGEGGATGSIEHCLQVLRQLDDEEPLAKVRNTFSSLDVNVLTHERHTSGDRQGQYVIGQQRGGVLPILYRGSPGEAVVEHDFSAVERAMAGADNDEPDASRRMRRSDMKYESEPFLKAFRLHRVMGSIPVAGQDTPLNQEQGDGP